MQVRSWMAAVVLIGGATVLLGGVAASQKSGSDKPSSTAESQSAGTTEISGQPEPRSPGK